MLVHSLASKYARFVVLVRQMYWTPPFRPLDPPLLKSDDLFFREPRDIGPPPFKNPGHAPVVDIKIKRDKAALQKSCRCLATDMCPSWPKVLNSVTVRGFMKTPV